MLFPACSSSKILEKVSKWSGLGRMPILEPATLLGRRKREIVLGGSRPRSTQAEKKVAAAGKSRLVD